MLEIQGKYTSAKIFTDNIESEALSQVYSICNHPVFENSPVRIQADTHAGKGCVIGFTAKLNNSMIIPNLIGVDINCGMLCANLGNVSIDLVKLDNFIRNEIPHGCSVNKNIFDKSNKINDDIYKVCKDLKNIDKFEYHLKSIGSLGGGNHFVEIGLNSKKELILTIHTGSRNFGHAIAVHHQKIAESECVDNVPKELRYLKEDSANKYLEHMGIASEFAELNRVTILKRIMMNLNIHEVDYFETVHNYISSDGYIRKGAISAKLGERVLIPINMRDGSILAEGLGNQDYNYSAPHGAGRIMSRSKAKQLLSLDEYRETMSNIFTTSVSVGTIDEAPMAYKPMTEIIENTKDTIKIIDIIKPIYNFKSN